MASPMEIAVVGAIFLLACGMIYLRSPTGGRYIRTPALEKEGRKEGASSTTPERDRAFGHWDPVHFTYPVPEPCSHSLDEMKPLPYRPFRWGLYNITMGIRPMPWQTWIQLDSDFIRYHHIRARRIQDLGDRVVRTLEGTPGLVRGGEGAAKELLYEIAEFVSRRFPSIYSITRLSPQRNGESTDYHGWYDEPKIKTITVIPVDITYDLEAEDPLRLAALLIQDDLAIMIEGNDGQYYFQAGAICVAGSWRLEDKIGMALDEIHTSGGVPQYEEKLQRSLNRFFRRMTVDKPVTRNNYFIQVCEDHDRTLHPRSIQADTPFKTIDPDELAWSSTTHGPEELYDDGKPHPQKPSEETLAKHIKPSMIRMRTERTTLRRLPKTGAIVFTIRSYMFRVDELAKEPGVPGRFASALRGWGEDIALYKKQALYRDVMLKYLDECHLHQVQTGAIPEDDRSSNYPF